MKQYKSCSIEYCEEVGRYKANLVFEEPGWILQGSVQKEERMFDTIEECYHWALCSLLNNNVSISRKIRISSTSTPTSDAESEDTKLGDGDTVHIQLGSGKRKRRGKKKKSAEE